MTRRPYQRAVIRKVDEAGFTLMIWRRQGGKTTTLAEISLKKMMKRSARLVTYASASLLLGREIVYKESQVLMRALDELRKQAEAAELQLQTADRQTGKNLKLKGDDFADLFQAQRLEFRLYHSRTVYSRTQVIAPNAATARGWTGDVLLDEIGFIRDFRDLWEAVEPISSTDPDFRVLMATTPPNDDKHYSFELAVPPEGTKFPVNPDGNWYRSQAGVLVHRVDVFDAAAAGVKIYDLNTREPLTPAEHRARALDKDAWDRNYALIFRHGGTCACSLTALAFAQENGRGKCAAFQIDTDADLSSALIALRELLTAGPVGIGYDVATTEKEQSNPSALSVIERVGLDDVARLVLRWKTTDPDHARAIVTVILDLIALRKEGGKARRLCIDATNERYFATDLKKKLGALVPVELVIASETILHNTEEMTVKAYLGNLLVNALEDGHLFLPPERWVKDDFRLVIRDRGSFVNELDASGNHGDTFDSTKLGQHALRSSGGAIVTTDGIVVGLKKNRLGTFRPAHLSRA